MPLPQIEATGQPAKEFVSNGGRNYVLRADGFFISYNPNTSGSGFGSILGSMFAGDQPEETALVREHDGRQEFRILNGDWRKDYAKLASEGWDACLRFYEKHRAEHDSSWTTPGLASAPDRVGV